MVRQTVIGAIEVEPFVFDSGSEIPFPSDEKAMSVAEIIVERVAISEFTVVIEEIAVASVVHLVVKKITMIFVCWRGRRLGFVCRRACEG